MSTFIDKLAAYGVNLDITLERFAGDEALYEQCLHILIEDSNFTALGEHIAAEKYEDAFASAHALKGVVGNLGFTPLYDAIDAIVEPLRGGDYSNLDALYAKVMEEFERVKQLAN